MQRKTKIETVFGDIKKSSFLTLAAQWECEKDWKENSQDIALEILEFLDENELTQRAFAEMMWVSPQVINKWLKGQENFTLETIGKMERVMKRKLIQVVTQPVSNTAISEDPILIESIYEKARSAMPEKFKHAKVVPLVASKYIFANVN